MNILVAEDDTISRRRLIHFLEKWSHNVLPAKDGREALALFIENDVDLVITDWMMPEMDGLGLVRQIYQYVEEKPYVYVILLTSKGDKKDVIQALSEKGVDDYITKPFDPGELQARVGVGERTVKLERALKEYSLGLEKIVQKQTLVIRQTKEETIYRLLAALETRDDETGGHVRRIALLSALMAEALGWSENDSEDLRLASPMHDIGKIGVPDAILRKPGPLTEAEFEIMKTHTTIGARILAGSEFAMLRMAHDVALSHHEKWSGAGYPEGLAGENIPEAGRIVALVDVYDALSHDRVYHKAVSEADVLKLMREGRGTHFDPRMFDQFMALLPQIRKIKAENP